ncbi:phosphate ABC transporter ATP-binding protein [bacterium]|nr:phosphate ABC transporter ATP-binding protein [bacterium]
MAHLFELNNIFVNYGNNAVLSGINLKIPEGIFIIVGPSGSGKSTLLRLLNRMKDPSGGEIFFRGNPLAEYPIRELRRRVGLVFQKPILFDGTVRDNIKTAQKNISDDEIASLLEQVGIPRDYISRRSDELSVGEAQRVCLARTLSTNPEVLLLDEPTSALDPTAVRTVENLLVKFSEKITLIWVTHLVEQALRLGGNLAMLYEGKIYWQDKTENLKNASDEIVKKFIRGELKEK